MTYTELLQKIRDYTEVDANVLTSTILDGIIENAEFRIFRDIDSDNNRRYATANLITSDRFISRPAGLLIVRSAQIVDSNGSSEPDNREFLQYRDTSFMSEFNNLNSQGVPKYYSNWDEDRVVVAPTPDQTYTIQLNYILKPTGLSSTVPTTYLSLQFLSFALLRMDWK